MNQSIINSKHINFLPTNHKENRTKTLQISAIYNPIKETANMKTYQILMLLGITPTTRCKIKSNK